MDLDVDLLQRHVIPEISVQPIGFFDPQNPASFVLLEEPHHLSELLSADSLGSLDVHEFSKYLEAMAIRVLDQQLGDKTRSCEGIVRTLIRSAWNP